MTPWIPWACTKSRSRTARLCPPSESTVLMEHLQKTYSTTKSPCWSAQVLESPPGLQFWKISITCAGARTRPSVCDVSSSSGSARTRHPLNGSKTCSPPLKPSRWMLLQGPALGRSFSAFTPISPSASTSTPQPISTWTASAAPSILWPSSGRGLTSEDPISNASSRRWGMGSWTVATLADWRGVWRRMWGFISVGKTLQPEISGGRRKRLGTARYDFDFGRNTFSHVLCFCFLFLFFVLYPLGRRNEIFMDAACVKKGLQYIQGSNSPRRLLAAFHENYGGFPPPLPTLALRVSNSKSQKWDHWVAHFFEKSTYKWVTKTFYIYTCNL